MQEAYRLLPSGFNDWLNSPPLSMAKIRGKVVVLWFFEEGCPRCRAKWPELYEIERRFQSHNI